MAAVDLAIVGAQVPVPGSEFLLHGLAQVLVVVGIVATVTAVVIRLVRRRRNPTVRRRPVGVSVCAAVMLLGLALLGLTWPPTFIVPEFPALPRLLPEDAFFYRPTTDLPVAADSDRQIASLDGVAISAGFRSTVVQGVVFGMPFNLVDANTPMLDVEFTRSYSSGLYPGPYPMADPAYIQGPPTFRGDQHYLAVDVERRQAWELFYASRWFGRWQAASGAMWSMDSLDYPTGATIAARLPLLPGVITYAEVDAGRIDHVIFISSQTTAAGEFVWPARGTDGRSNDPDAPPMGSWLRLSADADLSGLGPQALVVARAAQQYGVVLSDTAPGFSLRGTIDRRWDDQDLRTLGTLSTDDFEVVDTSGVMVSVDSMAARLPAG